MEMYVWVKSMTEIVVASLGVISAVLVALVEKTRRESKKDHGMVAEKLDNLGRNLGRSIDRVEQNTVRTEGKLDGHIAEHARGAYDRK
jgi:hypothetical protein